MNRLSKMERFYKKKADLRVRRANSMAGKGIPQEEVTFMYVDATIYHILSQMYAEIRNAIRYQRNSDL